jgi:hypothetical protein
MTGNVDQSGDRQYSSQVIVSIVPSGDKQYRSVRYSSVKWKAVQNGQVGQAAVITIQPGGRQYSTVRCLPVRYSQVAGSTVQ